MAVALLRGSVLALVSDQVPALGLALAAGPGLGLAVVPAPAQEAAERVLEVSAKDTGMV